MLTFNEKPSAYTFDHISMRMLLRTTAPKSITPSSQIGKTLLALNTPKYAAAQAYAEHISQTGDQKLVQTLLPVLFALCTSDADCVHRTVHKYKRRIPAACRSCVSQ